MNEKTYSRHSTILGVCLCLFVLYGILALYSEPPEFAQDCDKPVQFRHTHKPNRTRVSVWYFLHPDYANEYGLVKLKYPERNEKEADHSKTR